MNQRFNELNNLISLELLKLVGFYFYFFFIIIIIFFIYLFIYLFFFFFHFCKFFAKIFYRETEH